MTTPDVTIRALHQDMTPPIYQGLARFEWLIPIYLTVTFENHFVYTELPLMGVCWVQELCQSRGQTGLPALASSFVCIMRKPSHNPSLPNVSPHLGLSNKAEK